MGQARKGPPGFSPLPSYQGCHRCCALAPSDPFPEADAEPASPLSPSQRPDQPRGPSLALRLRQAHANLAPLVLAPLLITAGSGVAYRLLRDWGGWGRDRAHGLMVVHEGEWLKPLMGEGAETFYVLLNGLGLLWMLGSGAWLAWDRWRRSGSAGGAGNGGA